MYEFHYKKRQSRGPKHLTGCMIERLIIAGELTDKEICAKVKERFPDASTSTKAVQYYRFKLREAGKLPPAKRHTRKDVEVIMYELIPSPVAAYQEMLFGKNLEKLEGQYDSKGLIKRCREVYAKITNSSIRNASEYIYSVPTCAKYLWEMGWECVEFKTTVKSKEYVEEL